MITRKKNIVVSPDETTLGINNSILFGRLMCCCCAVQQKGKEAAVCSALLRAAPQVKLFTWSIRQRKKMNTRHGLSR